MTVSAFLIFVIAFLSPYIAHAIYGGDAPPKQRSNSNTVVTIRKKTNPKNSLTCSAIVLAPKYLLTAAHCVEDYAYRDDVEIVYDGGEKKITRASFPSFHPQYRNGFRDNPDLNEIGADLALLRFSQELDSSFTPAILPSTGKTSVGRGLLIANGTRQNGEHDASSELKVSVGTIAPAQMPAMPTILQYRSLVTGAGPCDQDSGGGIFEAQGSQLVLVGVASSKNLNVACGDPTDSGYAAPIRENLGWIKEKMAR